jgi:hypothetical protein
MMLKVGGEEIRRRRFAEVVRVENLRDVDVGNRLGQ